MQKEELIASEECSCLCLCIRFNSDPSSNVIQALQCAGAAAVGSWDETAPAAGADIMDLSRDVFGMDTDNSFVDSSVVTHSPRIVPTPSAVVLGVLSKNRQACCRQLQQRKDAEETPDGSADKRRMQG